MDPESQYAIRQRAYELWEEAGSPPGKHLDYWLAAEKELAGNDLDGQLKESFPASDPPSSTMRDSKSEC